MSGTKSSQLKFGKFIIVTVNDDLQQSHCRLILLLLIGTCNVHDNGQRFGAYRASVTA